MRRELNGGARRIIGMDREWKGLHPWQWSAVRELFPKKKIPYLKKMRKGGRPRTDDRKCLEAILWSARTGLPWRRLPERFGKTRTVTRRLAQWQRTGRLHTVWARYLQFTGTHERENWRLELADACGRSRAFWRLELRAILDIEWPAEKRYT